METVPLYAHERRQRISALVDELGRVSVLDLSQRFGVSEVTIRKDLAWLEANERVLRTHGGALPAGQPAETGFDVRQRQQRAEKAAIGRAAAALVRDGESIALDASTTALQVARHLGDTHELTVVTNGLRVANDLADRPGVTVLMPGGRLRWAAVSLVGGWGASLLEHVNIQRAFLGAAGFDLRSGLTGVTEEEAQMKRSMAAAARQVVAVIDHTKWDKTGFATFASVDEVGLVITDGQAPAALVREARARGIEVLQVPAGNGDAR
jgi:DeoR family transcriptional regulator of aga operon/DeoR family fructose operon transcriptional repressor